MYCTKCGTQLPDNASYCNKCGATLDYNPIKNTTRKKNDKRDNSRHAKTTWVVVIVSLLVALAIVIVVWKDRAKDGWHKASETEQNNLITIDNPSAVYFGGVSFDLTFDEYIEKYNQSVSGYFENYKDMGEDYILTSISVNAIDITRFMSAYDDITNCDFFAYWLDWTRGDKKEAALEIICDHTSGKVISVQYIVSASLYDSENESRNFRWKTESKLWAFSPLDEKVLDEFGKIENLSDHNVTYENGVVYSYGKNETLGIPTVVYEMSACSSNSEMYYHYYPQEGQQDNDPNRDIDIIRSSFLNKVKSVYSYEDDYSIKLNDEMSEEYDDIPDVFSENADSVCGFIIPYSDSAFLSEEDLKELSKYECTIARNEIYARHGRKFVNEELQEYFLSQDWYTPSIEASDFDESMLNEYEKKNAYFIRDYEKSHFE